MKNGKANSKPLAYDAYQDLADDYAAKADTKPHNAFYDRPAVISLWPDLHGRKVLDAGCGPGAYSQKLLQKGAKVVACDMSERMLEHARKRCGDRIETVLLDLTEPLTVFDDGHFDMVNAPLCLDYIEDWEKLFRDFNRILRPGGQLICSFGHPSFDAEYFKTTRYFSVEKVECTWTGFGKPIQMPSFRRSLAEALNPFIRSEFQIDKILEPTPTDDFKNADPIRYQRLMHRPCFLCVRAIKVTS